MLFRSDEEVQEQIQNIVNKNNNYKFRLFGSRARGDYKKTSDIDIAIFENVEKEDEYRIRNEFDKLNIIYQIDLVFINAKIKKELLNSIIRDGVDL